MNYVKLSAGLVVFGILLVGFIPYSANYSEIHSSVGSSPTDQIKLHELLLSQKGVRRVLVVEKAEQLEISWTMVRNIFGYPKPPLIEDLITESKRTRKDGRSQDKGGQPLFNPAR